MNGSVALAWCFEDEVTPFTQYARNALDHGAIGFVPPIWPSEVANGVLVAERRGRISASPCEAFLSQLLQLPIKVVPIAPAAVFQVILTLARKERLTVYDATYLGLALRRGLLLATLDSDLRKATSHVGGVLLEALQV